MPALKDWEAGTAVAAALIPVMVLHAWVWGVVYKTNLPGVDWGLRLGYLLTLSTLCIAIIVYPYEYVNTAPDFGRWVEYTLTAPLQVVLVALSVWARDGATLGALATAQGAMMLAGVVTEDCLQTIYETNYQCDGTGRQTRTSRAPEVAQRRVRAVHIATITFLIAWASYALIWYVIVTQYQSQQSYTGKCDACHAFAVTCPDITAQQITLAYLLEQHALYVLNKTAPLPQAVTAPSLTEMQALLLTRNANTIKELFAFPQFEEPAALQEAVARAGAGLLGCESCPTAPPDELCEVRAGLCEGRNNIPKVVPYIIITQGGLFASFGVVQLVQLVWSRGVCSASGAAVAWHRVSLAYAVLSVSAKTALEVGFLVMLAQMPESTARPDGANESIYKPGARAGIWQTPSILGHT